LQKSDDKSGGKRLVDTSLGFMTIVPKPEPPKEAPKPAGEPPKPEA